MKFLNDKLGKNDGLKEQSQDVATLHQEIESLREFFSKFVGSTKNLDKLLRYSRCPSDRSGHGYEGNVYIYDKETTICYLCEKPDT